MIKNQNTLIGGYKHPYDPRPMIQQVIRNRFDKNAWNELWNELHHQGDVGTASYAAVPLLVEGITDRLCDYNFYGLIATIEIQRNIGNNPPLPEWLEEDYLESIKQCIVFAHMDFSKSDSPLVTQVIMVFFSIEKNDFQLARIFLEVSRDDLVKTMEDYIGF